MWLACGFQADEKTALEAAGVFAISSVVVTPDGKSYAYTFASSIGSLYLAEGIR